ncbi:phytoene/squalene synthase family protein [Parasphingorhabdus sp.]|uniref:phytoene/squalene synthase family protein n=1 Tax=Parasphingorhabdus sp. TaxID=2709688 RepID=UPI0032654757
MNRANLVRHAKASIERGSRSFALASKLFSAKTRERAWLLYFWCRACDDLADGQDHGHGMSVVPNPEKTVAAMRMMTARAYGGEQTGKPPFDAFGVVAKECGIPKMFSDDMIDGFQLDARGWTPQTEDDLYQYCYHVAGAVGCMMAIVMGVSSADEDTLDRACDLGLAFQLSNIARDVAEDDAAGRCYLPSEWLRQEGLKTRDMLETENRTKTAMLVARLCERAEHYARSARVGAAQLPFRSRWAVLAAADIYLNIARSVGQNPEASLDQRVVTGSLSKITSVSRALIQAMIKPGYSDRDDLWKRKKPV